MGRAAASVQVSGTAHEVHAHLVVAGVDRVVLRDQDGEAERTGVLLGHTDLSVLTAALDGVSLCGHQPVCQRDETVKSTCTVIPGLTRE